jgi:hypothetical protein
MKKADDTMRAEYKRADFTKLERGKFHKLAVKSAAVVLLDPKVAKAFPTSEAVNNALSGLIEIAKQAQQLTAKPARVAKKAKLA